MKELAETKGMSLNTFLCELMRKEQHKIKTVLVKMDIDKCYDCMNDGDMK